MTGKEKCKMLKELRRKIALHFNLSHLLNEKECNYQGPCPGFCPVCDAELLNITQQLNEKDMRLPKDFGYEIFEKHLTLYNPTAATKNAEARDMLNSQQFTGIVEELSPLEF